MSITDTTGQPGTLPSIVASVLRAGLQFGGGYLAAHGFIGSDQTATFVGAGLFIAGLVWSVIQKVNAKKALVSAIAAPAGSAG